MAGSWSYSALLKQVGGDEEKALEMLAGKTGFGDYAPKQNRPTADAPSSDAGHDEIHVPGYVGPSDLDLANLGTIGMSLPVRTHLANFGTSVGDRLGVPWYGEPLGGTFNRRGYRPRVR